MAQVILLAVGFAALLFWSFRLFWKMRFEAHQTVESHLPAMGFGVGLMGLSFIGNAYLNHKQETFSVFLVGMMWIAILQGMAACILMDRRRGREGT